MMVSHLGHIIARLFITNMDLSLKSRIRIMAYLKSGDAYKNIPPRIIAKVLDKMAKYNQLEAIEDNEGNLMFAWGWWMLTDKALADYKNFIGPKDINRGKNMVGCFCINNSLSISSMMRAYRRALKLFKANTFTVYTHKKKRFLTFNYNKVKTSKAKRSLDDIRELLDLGGKKWDQQFQH